MSAELTEDIVGLVDAVVRPLIDAPEEFEVLSSEDEKDGTVYIDLKVAEGDTGKVIGRQGRIAKEIRTVVRSYAQRTGVKVSVDIVD